MRSFSKAPLYVALVAISILFAFPFYLVVVSSLQSVKGLDLAPPSMFPAEEKTVGVTILRGLEYWDGQAIWFPILKSDNLIDHTKGGAYFLKLDEKMHPTELVKWISDSDPAFNTSTKPNKMMGGPITIANARFQTVDGANLAVIASMARSKPGGYDEVLFVAHPGQVDDSNPIRALLNPAHSRILTPHFVWSNYTQALKGPEASIGGQSYGFITFLKNSFFLAIFAVVGQIATSGLAAFAFSRTRFRGRDGLFIVLLATLMIPSQVTLIPLFYIYKSLHWVNTFLPLMVPNLTAGAFNVFLIRQFMLGIPKELDESATIDGAAPRTVFWKVIFPNCVPVLVVVGLFTFIASWQDVLGPLIYLDNPAYRTAPLGLEYFRSPYVDNRPLLMAGAVLCIIPVVLVFLIAQRHILAGIATTGLKD